jgi:nitroreductase
VDFFEVVKNRRSVRQYKPDPVSREDILRVLDAANWAPSAMNWQPWRFLVVSGERQKALGESYRAVVENYTRNWDEAAERKAAISRDAFIRYAANFGNAPVLLVLTVPASAEPNIAKANLESASAAMENLVLAATALGLGTCWMTGPLNDEGGLRRVLEIPDDQALVAVTPLGYPAALPRPLPRVDPDLTAKVQWLD